MIDKDEMMMWEGDDGGGFGSSEADGGDGGEADVSRGMEVFEGTGEPQTQKEAEPEQGSPQTLQARPEGPSVDARQLAHEFGHVIGQHFQPPPKEMTVQEAKTLLNVWEPTPEWQTKYDNLETRAQAIAEQRDGLIKQADTIMRYRMNEMQQQMEQRYAPVLRYMQVQEAKAGEYRFAQSFPQLNQPGLRPLLFSVAQSMLASGAKFRSEPELFTAIAKGVESVIKVSNPQFSLGANGGPQRSSQSKVGGIPVTTPGGGGGASVKGNAAPKPRGLAIFD